MAKQKVKNTMASLIILMVFVGLYYFFTGEIPEEIKEIIPPELQETVIPKEPTNIPRDVTETSETMTLPEGEGNTSLESFNKAKRLLLEMYAGAEQFTTFYCGSRFDEEKKVSHDDSGFTFKSDEKRANRLEWEHVVPAHSFGQSFVEWREGHPDCVTSKGKKFKGRDCAGKINTIYRHMQSDMYNLRPAVGEVNGRRSNYSFAMIEGEKREFGSCNMEIQDKKAEPPDERYGDIARTYFYMESAYPGRGIISEKNQKLFTAWNNLDPVDEWECERNRLIENIQGNINHVVKGACEQAGL